MSKSIYNIFDCKNKTEFIKKLKSEDKAFEDIFSLAKEYKEHYQNKKTYKLSEPDDIKEIIETYRFSMRMSFPHKAHERDEKKQKSKSMTFSR